MDLENFTSEGVVWIWKILFQREWYGSGKSYFRVSSMDLENSLQREWYGSGRSHFRGSGMDLENLISE